MLGIMFPHYGDNLNYQFIFVVVNYQLVPHNFILEKKKEGKDLFILCFMLFMLFFLKILIFRKCLFPQT